MGIVNKILLTCKKASFLVSKKQETKLSFLEHIQLKMHLSVCDMCTKFKIQTDQLSHFIKKHHQNLGENSATDLSDAKKNELQNIILNKLQK
ncbi:MAG: hypothetical protein RLZZ175_1624 [Bacteroidota bacterium]|jgi:transcriptional regulator NrdR family protein